MEVTFVANETDLVRGMKNVTDALDDTGKALGDVGTDGKRDTEELERSIEDLGDTAKDVGKDIGDNITDGTDKASKGAKDLSDNVSGELADSLKDFDGTASGALEGAAGALEGLGGLVPGVGGLLAGLGAAGLGVLAETVSADAAEIEQRTKDMYDDMIESGQNFLSSSYLQEATYNIFGDPEQFAKVTKAAEDLGLPIETVAAAYAGWRDAIDEVGTKADELADKEANAYKTGDDINGRVIANYRRIQDEIAGVAASTDNAGARAEASRSTTEMYANAWAGVDTKAGGAKSTIDGINDKTVKITADVDTSAIERAPYNRTFRIDVEGYTRTGQRVV